MIILDLLRYFAKFPSKNGALTAFTEGTSSYNEYSELQNYITNLPSPLLPAITGYVFGQSYESVRKSIDGLLGTYLFVDFGEFNSSRDKKNSIRDEQRIAITVATKVSDSIDSVEECIISDTMLGFINYIRIQMISDDKLGDNHWKQIMSDKHSIVPIEHKELNSIGWSLIFSIEASDWFGVKKVHSSLILE